MEHTDSADSGILATEVPQHRRLPAVGGDVPFQTRGNPDHSERRHPNLHKANQLTSPSVNPRDRPLKSRRHAANNTVELYCPGARACP